jgi:hypothetical protein
MWQLAGRSGHVRLANEHVHSRAPSSWSLRSLRSPLDPRALKEASKPPWGLMPPRLTRDDFRQLGLGVEGDAVWAPFNPACLNRANEFIATQLVTPGMFPQLGGLIGLSGDVARDLSWLVPGSVATARGSMIHGAAKGSEWLLSEGAVQMVKKGRLPSPIGLANGFARLIRAKVHPLYGGSGPRPQCSKVASSQQRTNTHRPGAWSMYDAWAPGAPGEPEPGERISVEGAKFLSAFHSWLVSLAMGHVPVGPYLAYVSASACSCPADPTSMQLLCRSSCGSALGPRRATFRWGSQTSPSTRTILACRYLMKTVFCAD